LVKLLALITHHEHVPIIDQSLMALLGDVPLMGANPPVASLAASFSV
jgi:hypothetical protein